MKPLNKFENYNDSRWNFTTKRSNFHFDPKQETEDYIEVCQFAGEWDLQDMFDRCLEVNWANRNHHVYGPYDKKEPVFSGRSEQMDLLRAGANPQAPIFEHCVADDIEVFDNMAKQLGLRDYDVMFKNQRTGHMFHLHIDNLAARKERKNSFKVVKMDEQPETMSRFMIALDDWKFGQVMCVGTEIWSHWSKGDCITWDWFNVPYSWVNTGWYSCPMLQLTGYVTKHTKQLIEDSNSEIIVIDV
tara:strand:- start:284 stop:1015 length:732 start_codon:yes stop_codon:yes gene_type:complete